MKKLKSLLKGNILKIVNLGLLVVAWAIFTYHLAFEKSFNIVAAFVILLITLSTLPDKFNKPIEVKLKFSKDED